MRSVIRFGIFGGTFGVAAALVTHGLLDFIASTHTGAGFFANHAHRAFGAVIVIESLLTTALIGMTLAIALASPNPPGVIGERSGRYDLGSFSICAATIAGVATVTLFGMEVSECASAAIGFGWLGGSLFPGLAVLGASIAGSIALSRWLLVGRMTGFRRLIELLIEAIAHLWANRIVRRGPAISRRTFRLQMRVAPASRQVGLRAPPRHARS